MTDTTPNLNEACEVCGQSNPTTIETHHVVPRRYGGSDAPENLVKLCGSCHNAIERIYDERFYQRLETSQPARDEIGDVDRLGQTIGSRHSPDRTFPDNPVHISRSVIEPHEAIELDIVNEETLASAGIITPLTDDEWEDGVREFAEEEDVEYDVEEVIEEGIDAYHYEQHRDLELIHCGYCNTTFLPWNHADCAKHLQIKHHVSDPYLKENDNLSEWEQEQKRRLWESRAMGGGGS